MQNNNKLFKIVNYTLEENQIVVDIDRHGKEEEIKIPRRPYEQWLEDSSRLEWVNDWSNHEGMHMQQTGTFELDMYWHDSFIDKKNDLYDWLILKKVSEGVFKIEQPLSNILGGHFFNALNAVI